MEVIIKDIIKDNVYAITTLIVAIFVMIIAGFNMVDGRYITRDEFEGYCNTAKLQNSYIREQISDIKKLQLNTQKDIKTLLRMGTK